MGTFGCHPYVLLNYQKSTHEVFTIAHELGHAMHTYFSCKAQPFAKSDYEIFVAEIASTVNEVLMLKYLLANTDNVDTKKFLLSYYLDMFRTTLFRQTMFAEFELKAHNLVEQNQPLSAEGLSDIYMDLNKKYYGKAVRHNDLIRYEWARIPHFYTAFYVYQYATGITAAVSIANSILKHGDKAFFNYKKFLSAGGSMPPVEILKLAGVDLSTSLCVNSGIRSTALKRCTMKKSKIFLSIILVVVAAFALTACGTLDFTYVQNSDGTYTHIVKVTLTEEGVREADVGLTLDKALNALKEGFISKDYFVSADGNTVTARKNFDSVQALQNDLIGNGIITNDVKKDENAFVVKQTIFGDIKVSGKFISTNTWWFAGVLTSGGLSQINAEKIALKLGKADTSYTFVTPYESTTSNADKVVKTEDGNYMHVWNFDGGNDTAEITVMKIKGAMWYGIAIIAAVFVFLVFVVTKEIMSHKNTKRNNS